MKTMFDAHVMVVGMGGVGSWTAESLARTGVGQLSLIDFDLVCVTNGNRQLHAMKGTTGKPKVEVMAERLRQIHPGAEVEAVREFYSADNAGALLGRKPDLVVDAIDNLTAKTHLIATCKARGIPLVASGGASSRMDPTQIRAADMTEVKGDPFVKATRKILRSTHDFPKEGIWGVPTVYSLEPPAVPEALDYDEGDGFRCVCPQGQNGMHTCDDRNVIYGTASFVTGAFGLALASLAARTLLGRF